MMVNSEALLKELALGATKVEADPIEAIPEPDVLRQMLSDAIRQGELLRALLRVSKRKANYRSRLKAMEPSGSEQPVTDAEARKTLEAAVETVGNRLGVILSVAKTSPGTLDVASLVDHVHDMSRILNRATAALAAEPTPQAP